MTTAPDATAAGDQAAAAVQQAPIVSVRGDATLEVPPELVTVQVAVAAEDQNRRKALESLSRRNDDALAVVRSFGDAIERVETTGLSVSPVLESRASKMREEKVKFYRGTVRNLLTISDFAVLGDLAAQLSALAMTEVQGPWWRLRPTSLVYRQARADAARAAVTRASEYAEAVGGTLTALLELADTGLSSDGRHRPGYAVRAAAAAGAGGAGPGEAPVLDLQPVSQTVSTEVEARFTMTQPAALQDTGRPETRTGTAAARP